MGDGAGAMFCKTCDYPLVGVAGKTCPECGRAFDPADEGTFLARPVARRRRWARRGLVVLGLAALAEVFGPSRVARFTWTWPNAEGATVTSETRWCMVGPRWLPVRYPHLTVGRWTSAKPSGYVKVGEYAVWRVGVASVNGEGITTCSTPPNSRTDALVFGAIDVLPVEWIIDIRPGNFDLLEDLLLEERGPGTGPRTLCWTPHLLPRRSSSKRTE